MFDWLEDIWDAICNLPNTIGEAIKDIFVPDTEVIEAEFQSFMNELQMKFGFDTEFFEDFFTGERPVTDIFEEYEVPGVGKFNLKFLDTNFLYEGVTYFRPFIRGFIVLLMAFYNVKMILGFIRQDAGVVTGKAVSASMKKE